MGHLLIGSWTSFRDLLFCLLKIFFFLPCEMFLIFQLFHLHFINQIFESKSSSQICLFHNATPFPPFFEKSQSYVTNNTKIPPCAQPLALTVTKVKPRFPSRLLPTSSLYSREAYFLLYSRSQHSGLPEHFTSDTRHVGIFPTPTNSESSSVSSISATLHWEQLSVLHYSSDTWPGLSAYSTG